MDRVKPGHFYILGINEKRFWSIPLYYSGESQIIILEFDENINKWKESVWGKDQFNFIVEIEKTENTLPFQVMEDKYRRKTIKAVMER